MSEDIPEIDEDPSDQESAELEVEFMDADAELLFERFELDQINSAISFIATFLPVEGQIAWPDHMGAESHTYEVNPAVEKAHRKSMIAASEAIEAYFKKVKRSHEDQPE